MNTGLPFTLLGGDDMTTDEAWEAGYNYAKEEAHENTERNRTATTTFGILLVVAVAAIAFLMGFISGVRTVAPKSQITATYVVPTSL